MITCEISRQDRAKTGANAQKGLKQTQAETASLTIGLNPLCPDHLNNRKSPPAQQAAGRFVK